MGARRRLLRAAIAACVCSCALPASAFASASEESILMDDNNLIYTSPSHAIETLQRIAALGVDRVKISLTWSTIAPHSKSHHHPNFNASDPAAYPKQAWDRYDLIARAAPSLGLKAYFELNPPAPAWATPNHKPSQGYSWSQTPNPDDFRQFVEAVGKRYSGNYLLSPEQSQPPPSLLSLPIDIPGVTRPVAGVAAQRIPRVDYWGIWNEPNEAAWLNPQWNHISSKLTIVVAPSLYRRLVDVAWTALNTTGHGQDTILIGETASRGWILPTPFIEDLYCVSSSLQPLTGTAAHDKTCPTSGDRHAFVAAHPGLFKTSGYAHHPYSFDVPPSASPPFPGEVTLAKLGGFERTLTGIFATYGQSRSGGVPIYLTEWGYKTNPPNPYVHTTQQEQAIWLNQGEYMTYNDPYVRSLTQFLLVDDGPNTKFAKGSRAYWSTPDTGLLNLDLSPKPAYGAYRLPIWVPVAQHGSGVTIWGQLRPANHNVTQVGEIQYRAGSHGQWTNNSYFQTNNPEGFFITHVSLPAAGQVRIAFGETHTKQIDYSRKVKIS